MAIQNDGGGGSYRGKNNTVSNRNLFGALAPKTPPSPAWHPPLAQGPYTQPKKPAAPAKPAPKGGGGGSRSYSGGGSGGGGTFDTFSAMSAPAPTAPSEEDYLAGDATYQATIAALARQLASFNTDIDSQLSTRKIDYDNALQQLGWRDGGNWNFEDQMTAAGRGYQSLLNDFASRGMIQSQAFGDAQNDLTRTLNKQYEGMNTANTQFIDDMTRQKTKASDENTAATQSARAEAILRRAAQYGFGV